MTCRQRALAAGGTLFVALLAFSSNVAAQTPPPDPITLYSFIGGRDGAMPWGNMAIVGGPSGPSVLYGATNSDPSVVFSLTPSTAPGGSWTYEVLHSFTGGSDGAVLLGGVVMGGGGVLYGTTLHGGGGARCDDGTLGCGTVFSLTLPASPGAAWTEAVLYSFTGASDGGLPCAGVTIGAGGVLYGTTIAGGTFDWGTVFSLTPPASPGAAWSETVLHSFASGRNGASPYAAVVIGPGGGLYGTTSTGGTAECGTVFTLKPPASPGGAWTEGTLYSFACAPDGNGPVASVVMGGDGALYGTTGSGGDGNCSSGCGTVFSLTPPASPGGAWTEAVLGFGGSPSEGASPRAGVVIGPGGVLYGTTLDGGISNNGTVFAWKP